MTGIQAGSSFGPPILSTHLVFRGGLETLVPSSAGSQLHWLGRVQNVEENGAKFEIQWYKKKGRTMTFQAMLNKDGSRMTSVLPSETVMLWEFSTNRTDNTFDISKEYLDKIQKEYADHDRCYV